MKLGCCGIFGALGENRYRKMKEYGFDYQDYYIRPKRADETDEEFEKKILEDKALADEAGIQIGQLHAPFIYPPHDETEKRRLIAEEGVRRSIRCAQLLNSPYVVYHPLMPYGAQNDPDPESTWAINEEFVRKLLPYAKECGVVLCIENMGLKHLSVSSVQQMVDFVRRVNDDNFKFCLDTGHAWNMELDPAEAVRIAGKELRVLHVHDNHGKYDHHLIPYLGNIDWKAFYAALREVGYEGVFSLEINAAIPNLSPHLSFDAKMAVTMKMVSEIFE